MSDSLWSPLAQEIVTRILIDRAREWPPEIRSQAEYLSAIWVGYDMWSAHFLGVDGQAYVIGENFDDMDDPEALTIYHDRKRVLGLLVWGSRRYPELKALLPIRQPGAIDCPCQAHPFFAEGKVICPDCGGMGWLPANLA